MHNFNDKLKEICLAKNNRLCIGLDVDNTKLKVSNKLIESEFLRQVSNSHAALFIKALRNKPLGNFSTFARSRTVVPTGTVTENGLELPGPG